jgi:hypothetical protein
MSDVQQPADPRAELEGRLNQLHDLIVRIEGLQQQEAAIYQRHAHRYVGYKGKWKAGAYWLWVLVLTLVLSVVAFVVFAVSVTAAGGATSADGQWLPQFLSLFVFLTPLPIALVVSAIILGVRNARVPKLNTVREQENQQRSTEIAQLVAPELAPFEAQLGEVRTEFDTRFRGWFPERYLTTTAPRR